MSIPVPPSECTRTREAVSGWLDEELTELEAVRLEVHLRHCPDCRAFAAQTAAITAELRRAPLEVPVTPAFAPRRRTRVAALRVQVAAVAAVAVTATGSLLLGRMVATGGGGPSFSASAPTSDLATVRQDAAEQRLLALLPRASRPGVARGGPLVPL
jgi:predicted anti-sigma-YlaC factor YlaD